jgi:D-alanyl-lipoteichoic acid acyltransferase DltB (MBOAT superfamily)
VSLQTSSNVATAKIASRDVPDAAAWPALGQMSLLAQLFLALAVVYLYKIEGSAFLNVFGLAVAGFAVNLVLPLAYRLQFFVGLSLVGAVVVFGVADAAWLIGSGLLLISLCHLPASQRVRVIAVVAAATVLAVSRAGLITAPWSAGVWPILGSMFMFRLVLYMMSSPPSLLTSPWSALAYFFMLPNLVFPLFPVVDYQTFRRTYYDRKDLEIYEQGLLWICRGLVHLVLYRFVYYNVLNDPIDVIRLSDVVQSMLGTFLLYLRVSGQFHLIVGLLHLFGFRLPETHKLYYLAHSFTELWRRINIYWTDFMMKTVFYPTYFRVKRLGPSRALVLSTVAVFVVTWLLHSYQWFWLRGGFPVTAQDTLFWGLLALFVVRGALKESQAPKTLRTGAAAWSWRLGLQSATTFLVFCLLWSLWSTDSVSQWLWMITAAGNVDVKGVLMIAGTFTTVLVLGGRHWDAKDARQLLRISPRIRTIVPLVVLLLLAQPAVFGRAPQNLATALRSLQLTGLNARDSALQNRGYYEQLDVRGQLNERVLDVLDSRSANWAPLASTGILHERERDMLTRELVPSKHVVWNGKDVTTNRWGMRDQEYTREKPEGTYRIALVGPSLAMGSGIADGETFESLVEQRLNTERPDQRYQRYEILNFGIEGHTLPEQVAMLENRVFEFNPDLVIAIIYHPTRSWTERYIRKILWGGVSIPDARLTNLLAEAGLNEDEGSVTVPFTFGRRIAGWFGVKTRMPTGESEARIRWITDQVVDWSIVRFGEVAAEHRVTPLLLGLNAVIDDVPDQIPHQAAIREAQLPVIDLFHIYPESDYAALRVAEWDEHPNASGHRLIADHLYPELAQFIRSNSRATK